VTWYYKLQSSTLAKPAKPTTKVPSGWDDTEPSYTPGSTNSLYVVELTEYTDGTWAYSEVSLSSSYEAAKEAYNKAANAAAAAAEAQNALDISLDVITGTQTAATGAWTGKAKFSELKDGQQIVYWLPFAGSGNATLNLTLANGATTGAKNCYYGGTTRITTHYPAGSAIRLIYRKAAKVGNNTYEGWWADANYDSGNTYDRTRYQQPIKCGGAAIVAGNIIVGSGGVYKHLKAGTAFDITYQILYAGSAIAANATGTNNYVTIGFTVTTTQSITLTAYKPVYIKGKLSGTSFTPVSTAPLTQTIPTSADGYHYILLGQAYSTTGIYLLPEHPIFMWYNGSFKSFEQIAAEAAANIDGLEIGGRNYVLNSTFSNLKNSGIYSFDGDTVTFSSSETGITDGVSFGLEISNDFKNNARGKIITMSVEYYVEKAVTYGTSKPWIGLQLPVTRNTATGGASQYPSLYGNITFPTEVTNKWIRKSAQFSISDYGIANTGLYFFMRDASGTVKFRRPKVEISNRPTDWSPAPEDTDKKIDKVQESVNGLTKTVFSVSTPTDTSVLWIDTSTTPAVAKRYNPDTVAWEIVNDTTEILNSIREDVKSVINQLPDQIDMSVKSQTYLRGEVDTLVNEVKSMLTQTENELSITLSELRGSIDDVDGKIDASLENYETYFKFRSTGMYIGKNDSTIKLRLSNDRLSFTENDVEVAYISDRKMYITELEVTGNILWDGWGWTHESNGSRSFGKIR